MCQRKQLKNELIHHDRQFLQSTKPLTPWKKANISSDDYSAQLPTSTSYNLTSGSILENFIEDSIDRSRVESERAFLNQTILEATQPIPLHDKTSKTSLNPYGSSQVVVTFLYKIFRILAKWKHIISKVFSTASMDSRSLRQKSNFLYYNVIIILLFRLMSI